MKCTCNSSSISSKGSCILCPIKNGTGLPSITNSLNCECLDNFAWNGKACLCNAPLTYTATNSSCDCNLPYEFNSSNVCVCPTDKAIINSKKVCILCSSITYATTPNTASACYCQTSFIWTTAGICDCNSTSIIKQFDTSFICTTCDAGLYAKAKVAGVLSTKCSCPITSMTWNTTSQVCDCANNSAIYKNGNTYSCVVCNSLVYANSKINSTTCNCSVADMKWTSGKCSCDVYTIITPDLSCLPCSNTVALIDKYVCGCPSGSIWNDINQACISCGNIFGSNGTVKNNLVCFCNTTYYWDVMTLRCVAYNATCTATKSALSCMDCSAIPFTFNSTAVLKVAASVRALFGGAAIATLLTQAGTNYKTLASYMCICLPGYKW